MDRLDERLKVASQALKILEELVGKFPVSKIEWDAVTTGLALIKPT